MYTLIIVETASRLEFEGASRFSEYDWPCGPIKIIDFPTRIKKKLRHLQLIRAFFFREKQLNFRFVLFENLGRISTFKTRFCWDPRPK